MRKLIPSIALLAAVAVSAPVFAHDRDGRDGERLSTRSLPSKITLPNGWLPEGIASAGKKLYAGSRANGAVWVANANTGQGRILVPGKDGRSATGIEVVGGRLLVAGAGTGHIFVYNRFTGTDIADYDVDGTFINDVTTLRGKAYFTDSEKQQLYVMPKRGTAAPTVLPITGDLVFGEGFDANGIEAVRGRLVTIQSATGKLFTINPATGASKLIDLGGATLPNGDGLLAFGRTLLVVQNRLNQISIVRLSRDLTRGRVSSRVIKDPDFDVPTTITWTRRGLYAVNARFTTPPTPNTTYNIVRVDGK